MASRQRIGTMEFTLQPGGNLQVRLSVACPACASEVRINGGKWIEVAAVLQYEEGNKARIVWYGLAGQMPPQVACSEESGGWCGNLFVVTPASMHTIRGKAENFMALMQAPATA